jgi:hypothetical protein
MVAPARYRSRAAAPAVALALALAPVAAPGAPGTPTPSATATVGSASAAAPAMRAVHTRGGRVTLVADTGSVLTRPPAATVEGVPGPAEVSPVWSDGAAIGLVVDVSADAAAVLREGGLAGAAAFLLQVPPRSRSGVVADRRPPAVAAEPTAGASDDLSAVSALTSGGSRDTSAALTLALRRLPARPGDRSVIVLFTSAGDAGGEPAAALGARVRDAGAVLAVVTTSPGTRYWAAAAEPTGGIAVATSPATAIRAFDQVANALRSRYVVSFDRPAAPVARLRWTGGGPPVTVPVTIPAAPAVAGTRRGTQLPEIPGVAALAAAGAALVLALAGSIVIAARRRGARERDDDLVSAVPTGVRVFDIGDDAPTEITNSLFEPRSVRDAREREARAWEARRREASGQRDPGGDPSGGAPG